MNRPQFSNLSEKETGYLTGFFIGDGYCFYSKKDRHYMVEFCFSSLNDVEISKTIVSLIDKLGIKCFKVIDKRFNAFKIKSNSRKLMEFILAEKENFIKDKELSRAYKIGLISGFIDSDGYAKHGEILLTQKNRDILIKFLRLTESLGIETKSIWSKKNYKTENLIWRARISTKFKHLKHNSYKVNLAYSGVEQNLE